MVRQQGSKLTNFIEELKRRKVLTTAAGYAVVAWIVLQVGEVTFEALHIPGWGLTLLVILVFAGFPVVVVVSWFFDLTVKGFKKDPGTNSDLEAPDSVSNTPGPSVAVLAFEDMSPNKDQEYFCNGIAEEILNRLAQNNNLHVASRTSSLRYREQSADVITIGEQLKVAAVLEGSVRKADNHLRVTTQLVNSKDGYHLWSQVYDRKLENIFEIQDEIATSVATALEVKLIPAVGATHDVQAYEYYLKGLHYFHRWGVRNVQYAIDMFARAVACDPAYARGWAALGNGHAVVCMYWSATEEHLGAAEEASEKSLQLAPDLAETHVSRGLSHAVHGRHDDAVSEFKAAIKLNPDLFDAYYFYARVSFQQGNLQQASELFEIAEQIDPDDFQAPIFLRQTYRSLGRLEEAKAAAIRGTQRAERHLELNPDDTRALNLGLGGLAELGEREKVRQWAQRSLTIDGDNPDTLYNVACGYALVGDHEDAIDCLERASLRGTSIAQWAKNDSDLQSLHGNPRFIALMELIKP